ncbi:inositol monophosphatase family protein [Devosia sp. MC1541]|uniref:inositol monophosphatase family protein n=1 Tax=Devosia sp. MC1541 TaxID=2725264 RepID=UPI00145F57B1|nr:inositol monophosphatase family protein [Devosia sp. MC1541]
MTLNYDAILDRMVDAAREAGVLTQGHFKNFRDIEIGVKGPGDFVSDADRQSETLIRERLFAIDPSWSLTGEEFAPVDGADPEHRWLVDPIDGTTNFLFGQHYTITISLRRGSETVCGLVYNPVSDEMFTAMKGGGAFLNGAKLDVSKHADVGMMCIGTGLAQPSHSLYPGAYERLDHIRNQVGAVRVVGSAANSCAYVACGRLTGYYEETGFVDTAAGILLVQEAGGIVTDWWGRGEEHYAKTGALIVANPATHAFLLNEFAAVPPKNA